MNYYVGIDPGLKGAIAIIDEKKTVVDLIDMPITTYKAKKKTKNVYDIYALKAILQNISELEGQVTVFLEEMQSMPPGIRVQASFGLGKCQGIFEMGLTTFELPYELIKPKNWQKHFNITKSKGDIKTLSFLVARRLFPSAELSGPKGGKKDGRSDALLIAEFGRRKEIEIRK